MCDSPVHLAGLIPAPILYIRARVLALTLRERETEEQKEQREIEGRGRKQAKYETLPNYITY